LAIYDFEEEFNLHIWKINTYKTDQNEDNKLFSIRVIDSKGSEILYIKANDNKKYPKAKKLKS
jgi:hypothetical protein